MEQLNLLSVAIASAIQEGSCSEEVIDILLIQQIELENWNLKLQDFRRKHPQTSTFPKLLLEVFWSYCTYKSSRMRIFINDISSLCSIILNIYEIRYL